MFVLFSKKIKNFKKPKKKTKKNIFSEFFGVCFLGFFGRVFLGGFFYCQPWLYRTGTCYKVSNKLLQNRVLGLGQAYL